MINSSSILHNFWLKLFSVALATVIWLAIHAGIRNELSISQLNINKISLPIALVTAPGETNSFRANPPDITVYAVGDLKVLRKDIRVTVDLTDFHDSQSPSEEVHIEYPPEINVIDYTPKTVAIESGPK